MTGTGFAIGSEQMTFVCHDAHGMGLADRYAAIAIAADRHGRIQPFQIEMQQIVVAEALGDGDLAMKDEVGPLHIDEMFRPNP